MLSPEFDRHLHSMEKDIVAAATVAKSLVQHKHKWPNMSKEERTALRQMRELDVGYNMTDKNFGGAAYSKDKYKEQCRLHLEDEKGTYMLVTQTKDEVLYEVLLRLGSILLRLRDRESGL